MRQVMLWLRTCSIHYTGMQTRTAVAVAASCYACIWLARISLSILPPPAVSPSTRRPVRYRGPYLSSTDGGIGDIFGEIGCIDGDSCA